MALRSQIPRVGAFVLFGVLMAACATPAYTRSDALDDLAAQTSVTGKQGECLLAGMEKYFADQYVRLQAENGDTDVGDDEIEVYVKNQLAASAEPDAATVAAFDEVKARCL